MKILIKMALRNLRRNLRRTLLSMASIAFGLAVILWMGCLLAGRNKSMIDRITSSRTGHLQIHRADYLENKFIQQSFVLPEKTLQSELPLGSQVASRVYLPSMVSSGEQSSTIMLQGIVPSLETKVTNIEEFLNGGEFLKDEPDSDCPSRQIYIGKSLAELLKVGIGNKIVLMTQAADGTLGNDLFRVKGIFKTDSNDFDKAMAYAPLNCVIKLGALKGIHEVVIKLKDQELVAGTMASLGQNLSSELKVSTWKEVMPSLAAVINFNEAVLTMITSILFIVISLGIINVLLIGIFERTREFGVMIALGTTPIQLKIVVLLECLFLAVGAAVFGTALGAVIVLYHMKTGFDMRPFLGEKLTVIDSVSLEFFIFPIFKMLPFVKSVGATLFFVMMAGIYPAYRASKLKPVEAMRSV